MLSGDSSVAQGEQGAFYQMLSKFSRYWDRIDIICPQAAGATLKTILGNVYLHSSPKSKVLQPYFILRQGKKLLAEREYALIASHDFGVFYNGIGAWLLRQNALVCSEIHHVEGYPRGVTIRDQVYRGLAYLYIRWAARWVTAFRVVNTTEVPELLRSLGVSQEKILYLPSLYLDFDIFHPIPNEPCEYDVLFVGRLASNKGLFTILNALAQVRQTHPTVRLGILGRGPLQKALEERIAKLNLSNNVVFIPRQNSPADVAQIYNRAQMLVCASTAEGGPRVTVEAMACGTPVISTPVGIMTELIQDSSNGLLFQWDARELAEKIRLLLDDKNLRTQLSANGRESVMGFQADQVIERYARGYQDLIQRLQGQ
jgi:glycosyltransferase involved in cell wall biosynthesis